MKGLEYLAQTRLLFKLIALSVQVVQWNQRALYIYSIAIRVLEQQGLVEVIPKDGTYVTSFDSDQIKDGLHVRFTLEQLALKQSIERLSDSEWRKHCEHLQDLVDQMLKAAEDLMQKRMLNWILIGIQPSLMPHEIKIFLELGD